MKQIARRMFCGTAVLAFPLFKLFAQDNDMRGESVDSVLDTLADEIARITADGAQNGFKGEHFRRYAAVMRALDAHLEDNNTNREINRRLNEDDADRLDPAFVARTTVEYWERKGILFDENVLAAQLMIDPKNYKEIRVAVKKQGGIRTVHKAIADAFERKAKEFATATYRSGPFIHNGRVAFPRPGIQRQSEFMSVQYDFSMMVGSNLDCLCATLKVEAGLLGMACVCGLAQACLAAGVLGGMVAIMEGLGMCNASKCWH